MKLVKTGYSAGGFVYSTKKEAMEADGKVLKTEFFSDYDGSHTTMKQTVLRGD